ncbi:polysaccharide biosynthesis/export family protein [Nubsella zeaxanthinifaciens]|uniref:polysaccharide biosynthesis/export family protein n=1 Tax=Nubsella zeaxanthinifaciens TaxID=392412 RepID=UPI003CFCAC17
MNYINKPKALGIILCFAGFLMMTSCISNKRIIYLQKNKNDVALNDDTLIQYNIPVYRLQYNDIVDVQIRTSIPEMNAVFGLKNPDEPNVVGNQSGMLQSGGDAYYMTGYTLNQQGEIKLPFIGKLAVGGLTLEETEKKITERLGGYFKKASDENLYVKVKLGGIRFSTFGEFNKPGRYVILQERLTIFEAIANSGDMTTVAKRNKVLLLRQYPEGTKIHVLDLNNRDIIKSPYYFIQPNDQLYAEPMKVRELGAGTTTGQTIQILVTILSAAAVIVGLTK